MLKFSHTTTVRFFISLHFRSVSRLHSSLHRFLILFTHLVVFRDCPKTFPLCPKTSRYCPKTFPLCPRLPGTVPRLFRHCPQTFWYRPKTSSYCPRTPSLQCWNKHCPKTPSSLVLGPTDFFFFVVGTL